ncbi:transposase [Kribbella antibiotica]|uniref:Transposase n=1 Tax=Kribbella antibiotica TaxID=190195 RepID=A0A4R4YUY6_9ACTN|nr:DDE-type integrase/transposase/recombinase [Kribbella antibiotica]TDD48294.1 transposase [Kribbella antibiotica]
MAAVRWWVVADLVVSMEVRFAIGALVVLDEVPRGAVSRLCREYGISRDTFYRYRAQLEAEGLQGLLPKSRRPHRSPNATPPEVVELLMAKHHELVADGWDGGAMSVRDWLRVGGVEGLPSVRTVHKILTAHGCVEATPAKRPHSSYRRFEAMSPNGMWQIDGTEWRLASGAKVVIVRVIDDHSRKILSTLAADGETGPSVWECMKTALDRHGKPVVVLSDNGAAFSIRRRWPGAYSEFEARLARIGVYHATCAPYHPQTCGKKERDWKPLKKWLDARPPAITMADLQRLLDGYDVIFNTQRPHQGIAGKTPDQRYFATPKAGPDPDQPPSPRTTLTRHTACAKGRINIYGGYRISLGREWAGAHLHVLHDNLHVVVFHGHDLVKRLTLDPDHKDVPSGLPRDRRPTKPLPST